MPSGIFSFKKIITTREKEKDGNGLSADLHQGIGGGDRKNGLHVEWIEPINYRVLVSGCHGHDNNDPVGSGSSHKGNGLTHTRVLPGIIFCYAIRADHRDVHQLDHPESLTSIEYGGYRGICRYRITLDGDID